jgi:hypothetical protein
LRPGVKLSPKSIHGHAGQTFGSVIQALGSDLPLVRGMKKKEN